MLYSDIHQIALVILSSIITGGYVIVFVEIGNRKNRNSDRHYQMMMPFMHKLSAFFRFVSWCHSFIIYPGQKTEKESSFKVLMDKMDRYGSRLIMAGGDYDVEEFSAGELNTIAKDINNIWYWCDKMNPCILSWEEPDTTTNEFITKSLKEINPLYQGNTKGSGVDLIGKVAGDFYVEVYLPMEYEISRYEAHRMHYNRLSCVVSSFIVSVLIILCLMLFVELPVLFLQVSTVLVVAMLVLSLVLLAVDIPDNYVGYVVSEERLGNREDNGILL